MKISIIIPIYNEEKTIEQLMDFLESVKNQCEIIFVDGGSTDRTLELIGERFTVLLSDKGRANQMNAGAEVSTGDVLFFLHCDSEPPKTMLQEIENVMKNHRAGCFGIAFHSWHFFMFFCRLVSNHRAKYRQIVFGDQGIFIERDLFFEVGMFPKLPILEDYQFSLTLREKGIQFGMTKHRIYTSDRRFPSGTINKVKLVLKMSFLRVKYQKGVAIEEIAKQYLDVR